MKPSELKISREELIAKLQSGELVVVTRENMERMQHARGERGGLKINLGSGQRPFKSPWINVDCQQKWNPDVVANGEDLRDHFQDESAEMIVLHHTLEHYGCGEADSMLKECYRILRPRGSLIVTVPNMYQLCCAYVRDIISGACREVDGTKMDTQLFMTNVYGAYHGDDADRHRWGFDDLSLMTTLQSAAQWGEVRTFDWREIAGANIARDWWILGIEAIK